MLSDTALPQAESAELEDSVEQLSALWRLFQVGWEMLRLSVLRRSGTARLENKDFAAALAELDEAVAIGERVLPADHAHLTEYRETLAQSKAAMAE